MPDLDSGCFADQFCDPGEHQILLMMTVSDTGSVAQLQLPDSPTPSLVYSRKKLFLTQSVMGVVSSFVVFYAHLASACKNYTCGGILVKHPFAVENVDCSDPSSYPHYLLSCVGLNTNTSLRMQLGSDVYQVQYIYYPAHTIGLSKSFENCTFQVDFKCNATYSSPKLEQKNCSKGSSLSYAKFVLQYVDPNDQTACEYCLNKNVSCGYDSTSAFSCQTGCSNGACSNHTPLIVGLSVGASIFAVCLLGVLLLFLVKRKRIANHKLPIVQFGSNLELEDGAVPMQRRNLEGTPIFSYRELDIATNSFSESRLLGGGGFSSVYKGILSDGQTVAVKKLNQCNYQLRKQFYNEVLTLSKVRHPHLIQLHGCCMEGGELLLVYEFVPNGTLADHLHGNQDVSGALSCATRVRIALETALALAYLHDSVSPPILHRDVKATNILLDADFHAKVGDFGLSRFVPLEATHISTAPQGTPGYLDPDYHQSYHLTEKSDVYSLGVLLMELISAQKAVDMSRDRREINLASFATAKIQSGALDEMIDPRLGAQLDAEVKQMIRCVAELAFICLSVEKEDRPCMREVAEKLQQILQLRHADIRSELHEVGEAAATIGDQNSEMPLLIKRDIPVSPISVIQTPWPRSNDSSNISI